MITNKKGLSDIVTTALIILLVAVAVAAVWAFVAPALRGTGTQFTKTSVCVSNTIEPITCKTTGPTSAAMPSGKFPFTVQVRRTLTDGVAVPTEYDVFVGDSGSQVKVTTKDTETSATPPANVGQTTAAIKIPRTQGEMVEYIIQHTTVGQSAGASPQTKVVTTYRQPDNTVVKCESLPITCNVN